MTSSDLFGFVSAMGEPVQTAFRDCWSNGGVFLLDELDAAAGDATIALNNGIANGTIAFPGALEPTPRHPDFVLITAGNTSLEGADGAYSSRETQDGSLRDRLHFLSWEYDRTLEAGLYPLPVCEVVWALREACVSAGIDNRLGARSMGRLASHWDIITSPGTEVSVATAYFAGSIRGALTGDALPLLRAAFQSLSIADRLDVESLCGGAA
jgi:hypothetical protein